MKIGYDAKRAFHNGTGLGHYSRSLLQALNAYYPQHEYYLFNPRPKKYELAGTNLHEVQPTGLLHRAFPSAWRSAWVTGDLKKYGVQLYHGLSHEIPVGIQKTGIPSVVTMHDLIHERYPEQYNALDVRIYSRKFRYACEHATRVIAISEQTRQDLVRFYNTPPEKISVCYQSCNPAFATVVSDEEKNRVRTRYGLPEQFFLSVGSIIERKNLLNCCKAIFLLRDRLDIPLVVIGEGGKYKEQVKDYVRQNSLEKKILFLSDTAAAREREEFRTAADFPAIYQCATAMLYPSFFEGFGIPVLEALWSQLPVITSNVSCLPEAGGDAALYVNPSLAAEIAEALYRVATEPELRTTMIQKGLAHAQHFTAARCAAAVMNVYETIW